VVHDHRSAHCQFPGPDYPPYDTGMAGDHFVKNPDGTVYTGKVWPGPSVFPRLHSPADTRMVGHALSRIAFTTASRGFWNDMNEPSIFDSPTHTMPLERGAPHRRTGLCNRAPRPCRDSRCLRHGELARHFDGLLALDPNSRPFVLTRATYAGGQRYAATWTGDNSSSWNHLR
jgi:alpha-glucosidase